jgi:DNA-binding MarR family transcriptional regulator
MDACFNFAMRKSTRVITHFYEERLSQVGLKVGQFSVLRAVHFLKQTTSKELQRGLILDQTTLSRSFKPLIRDGLLLVSTDEKDKRSKLIQLSKKGLKLYQRALPIWKQAQDQLEEKLGGKDVKQIVKLSESIVKKLANI